MLHPGHTSIFLETVRRKFMGPRGRGPTYGAEGRGPRKTNTPKFTLKYLKTIHINLKESWNLEKQTLHC